MPDTSRMAEKIGMEPERLASCGNPPDTFASIREIRVIRGKMSLVESFGEQGDNRGLRRWRG